MSEHHANYPTRITGIARLKSGKLEKTDKELDLRKFKDEVAEVKTPMAKSGNSLYRKLQKN